jgi:hypothetical protein
MTDTGFKVCVELPSSGELAVKLTTAVAANIIISMATVKMVLAGCEDHSISQRCAIAGELLDGLSTIPTAYIQASSTAMVRLSCHSMKFLFTRLMNHVFESM